MTQLIISKSFYYLSVFIPLIMIYSLNGIFKYFKKSKGFLVQDSIVEHFLVLLLSIGSGVMFFMFARYIETI